MAWYKGKNATERALTTFGELRNALERMEILLMHQLDSFDLTMNEFRVLDALRGGPMSNMELGKKLVCHAGNITRITKNLERRGLIAAHLDKKDGRKRMAHLTAEGTKKIADVFPHHVKLVRGQMSAIVTREQDTLRRICRKLSLGNPIRLVRVLTAEEDEEEANEG
jgi:MarR family transcriptional regulator, 2-MHQ and catechol-resistance regulon repressor